MEEVLCRKNKSCPLLIGDAGVGKTANIEGLAHRIVEGDVPEDLREKENWALLADSLVETVRAISLGWPESKAVIIISEDTNVNIYTLILEKIGKNDELILN